MTKRITVQRLLCLCVAFAGASFDSDAQGPAKAPTDIKPGSITYEDIPYPYPVLYMPLTLYGQDVRMAYMDVPPSSEPNGATVVLMDGKRTIFNPSRQRDACACRSRSSRHRGGRDVRSCPPNTISPH